MLIIGAFGESPKRFYIRNYVYTGIFIICLFLMNGLMAAYDSRVEGLLVNGAVSIGLAVGCFAVIWVVDREFRNGVRSSWIRRSHLW